VIHTTKQTDELLQAAARAAKASDETVISTECWCLHGAVGAASDWRSFASALTKHGISTRAVDLWRFLQCESVSMQEFGKCLNADAAGEVSRSQRRILIGYSMGGRLALHALLENGPWDPLEISQRRSQDAHWATRALTESWADFLSAWNAQPVLGGAMRDEREDKKLIQRRREIARSFVDWSVANQENLWDRLNEIKVPVLWIAGESDTKFSAIAQEASAKSPNFSLAIAPATGHRVPWENQAWLNDRILPFISAL
jgi:2-succinyl-6-hydroxy-2,4-cyclohexadiene-1-carboxylate synthase